LEIKQIMHRRFIVLNGEVDIEQALHTMNEQRINGAPVVDNENNLIGIVVKQDLYRFLTERGRYPSYPLNRAMTCKVITATEDEDIVTVAKRLRRHDILALPVVDGSKVIGLVSVEDIVEYFLNQNTSE